MSDPLVLTRGYFHDENFAAARRAEQLKAA